MCKWLKSNILQETTKKVIGNFDKNLGEMSKKGQQKFRWKECGFSEHRPRQHLGSIRHWRHFDLPFGQRDICFT